MNQDGYAKAAVAVYEAVADIGAMMIANPEYGRLQFTIADLLAIATMVSLLLGTSRLPVSMLHAIPLLAVLYVVKYRILTLRVQPWLGLVLYVLVVAVLLPYLYCCIFVPWDDSLAGSPLVDWIGGPIQVFAVPTAFFSHDVLFRKLPSWTRSFLETLILIPLWVIFCVFIECVAGWYRFPKVGL